MQVNVLSAWSRRTGTWHGREEELRKRPHIGLTACQSTRAMYAIWQCGVPSHSGAIASTQDSALEMNKAHPSGKVYRRGIARSPGLPRAGPRTLYSNPRSTGGCCPSIPT
ncbi:uncharacterized protein JN550_011045 [Neoarthrinium moseri]|uniref:uncharacterized protein n=1 Tax=Neoarthrinium moseri TaxID=1658444 RepID=UPI001FDB33F4|nr:uncharacterized protein JN550_011045 [Neoarthrinium moseri]KAI1861223.1 hypothetical protein JN550_011045 [Neoarthrinium moseri]